MKRQRSIISTVAVLAAVCACAPGVALAGGPLLSGYGGPGAGAQAILGASLLNGSGGSAGGGSAGGSSTGGGAGGASGNGLEGGSPAASRRGASGPDRGRAQARNGSTTSAGDGSRTQQRAAGANPNQSHLGASAPVTAGDTDVSWFSGADLLALLLAAGALAIVALGTVRLTRTGHD